MAGNQGPPRRGQFDYGAHTSGGTQGARTPQAAPQPQPPAPTPTIDIQGSTDWFFDQNDPNITGVNQSDFRNTTIGATQGGPTGRGGTGSVDYDFERYQNYIESGGNPYGTGMINPARYQFNQDPFWAQNYGKQMDYLAAASAGRQAPQFDPNMAGYNAASMQGQQARNAGFGAVDALSGAVDQFGNQLPQFEQDVQGIRDVAMGSSGPSAAELAMQRSSDQAFRQNLATAATGARGGSMGSAFLNAGLQNSIDQGALTRDLGVQRAQEQAIARGQLLQGQQNLTGAHDQFTQGRGMVVDAFGNIRGQDISTAGMAGDIALRTEEGQVGTQLDQTRLNDDLVKFFTSQGYSAQQAQLMANIEMDQTRTGNYLDELAIRTNAPRPDDPSFIEEALPWIQGAGTAVATGALLLSDKDSKEEIARLRNEKSALEAQLASVAPRQTMSMPPQWIGGPPGTVQAEDMAGAPPVVAGTIPLVRPNVVPMHAPSPTQGDPFAATVASDRDSKEQINRLSAQLDMAKAQGFDVGRTELPTVAQPDTRILDMAYDAQTNRESLDPLVGYNFRYKPDAARAFGEDTEPRDGIMAQDMEKSPAGQSVVVDTPNGKALDVNRGLSFSLAGLAGLDKRVQELEAREAALLAGMQGTTTYPTVHSDVVNKENVEPSGSDFWERVGVAGKTMAALDPTIALGYMRGKEQQQPKQEPTRTPKEEDEDQQDPFSGATLPITTPSPGLSVAGRSPMATQIAARPQPIGPLNPTPSIPGQPNPYSPGMLMRPNPRMM